MYFSLSWVLQKNLQNKLFKLCIFWLPLDRYVTRVPYVDGTTTLLATAYYISAVTDYLWGVFGLREYLTIICSPLSTNYSLSIFDLSWPLKNYPFAIHDPSAQFSWVNFQNIENVLDKNFFFTFFGQSRYQRIAKEGE